MFSSEFERIVGHNFNRWDNEIFHVTMVILINVVLGALGAVYAIFYCLKFLLMRQLQRRLR